MFFLLRFVFPPSLLVSAASVVSLVSLANSGLSEVRGTHMQYSKFFRVGAAAKAKHTQIEVPSRRGMVIAYTPAFLAGIASFCLFPEDQGLRFLMLKSAVTIHFFKRVFETLFIHKYSGGMALDSVISISISYFIVASGMIYTQHLTQGLPEPPIDLKYAGIVLFLIGISGNFYHHYLLSKLRGKEEKEYKIPKGGLFDLVICPHYLFEILGFWGVSFISQNLYTFSFTLGSTFYLMGRSYATRRWYLSKFEHFPNNVKALIPYIF